MCCTVQRFCCACSLKTGSLIIGILEAILSAAGLIAIILVATGLAVVIAGEVDDPEHSKEEVELIHGGIKVPRMKQSNEYGTRLPVKKLMPNIIEAIIMIGDAAGEAAFSSGIQIIPSDIPFQFRRLQFPVRLGFAMCINKAQGQSLKVVGPCFSHVMLIVTCVIGVLVALQMIMSILLACGASNENPKFIKPWIIYSITGLTIVILLCLVMGGVAFAVNKIEAGVKFLIFCITSAVVQIYCMIVVNSYHVELTRARTGRTYAEVPQDIALQNYRT